MYFSNWLCWRTPVLTVCDFACGASHNKLQSVNTPLSLLVLLPLQLVMFALSACNPCVCPRCVPCSCDQRGGYPVVMLTLTFNNLVYIALFLVPEFKGLLHKVNVSHTLMPEYSFDWHYFNVGVGYLCLFSLLEWWVWCVQLVCWNYSWGGGGSVWDESEPRSTEGLECKLMWKSVCHRLSMKAKCLNYCK